MWYKVMQGPEYRRDPFEVDPGLSDITCQSPHPVSSAAESKSIMQSNAVSGRAKRSFITGCLR